MDKLGMYENFVPSMRMSLFYDEIYSSGLDRAARFPVDRYSRIAEKIQEMDTDRLIELKKPRLAHREEIFLIHDQQYVNRFLAQELRDDEIRRIGLRPWKPEIVERTMRLVGGAILLLVVLKATGMIAFKPSRRVLVVGGGITGLLSGLVGSAGPLGAAVFLSLGLPPLAYVASDATAAIAMHGAKTIVYGATIDLGPAFWPLAIAMGLVMIAGTWAGRSLIKRLPVDRFRQFVMVLLALIAVQMIVMG